MGKWMAVSWFLVFSFFGLNILWSQELIERKYYEDPGNYREEINHLKEDFKSRFGYELIDLEKGWKPEQIKNLSQAFARLPETFFNISGVKGFYHFSQLRAVPEGMPVDDIPAATFPSFQTVYRNSRLSYHVEVDDQEPRLEFFNSVFYEDREVFENVVQHEMAHLYDISHGFLSFSLEWLEITHFSLINLPALDGRRGDDYLFVPLNNAGEKKYAPVSSRQLPTYSRQNPQEDFANSVAAYINYPYFRYSHPDRYSFLKENVFKGVEYFPTSKMSYKDRVTADFDKAVAERKWNEVIKIAKEVGRDFAPGVEFELVTRMDKSLKDSSDSVRDLRLGIATCYLYSPQALDIRKNLIRKKRVMLRSLLEVKRCALMSRRSFEREFSQWSMRNIYFFRSKGKSNVQFLDPALPIAGARGFKTRYLWRIYYEGSNVHMAEGSYSMEGIEPGSVRINLDKTSVGGLNLPFEKPLIFELGVQRVHPKEFNRINSKMARIKFVIHNGFNYEGPRKPDIKIKYPFGSEFDQSNGD